MLSVNVLRDRKSDFPANDWIMDSGAFSIISKHGRWPHPVEEYAEQIRRWRHCGNLVACVSQDMMCEEAILRKTGLTVREHQAESTRRYRELAAMDTGATYILPVVQGYSELEYLRHLAELEPARGAWVGIGSICKRNGNPQAIEAVLLAIHRERPDLRLHGFGIKRTALASPIVWDLLHSADSMAWSYNARRHGRNQNSWREAKAYADRIRPPDQRSLFGGV